VQGGGHHSHAPSLQVVRQTARQSESSVHSRRAHSKLTQILSGAEQDSSLVHVGGWEHSPREREQSRGRAQSESDLQA